MIKLKAPFVLGLTVIVSGRAEREDEETKILTSTTVNVVRGKATLFMVFGEKAQSPSIHQDQQGPQSQRVGRLSLLFSTRKLR